MFRFLTEGKKKSHRVKVFVKLSSNQWTIGDLQIGTSTFIFIRPLKGASKLFIEGSISYFMCVSIPL